MNYNIDLLVAGCNTRCMHCYVEGGSAPHMTLERFQLALDRLLPVFDHFGERLRFTLDNELYSHPQCMEILSLVAQNAPLYYDHHGSTTGIALMDHPKRDELVMLLKEQGWDSAGLTIHGLYEEHDRVVARAGALRVLKDCADYLHSRGMHTMLSLMVSSLLLKDTQAFIPLIRTIPSVHAFMVIPLFMPTKRLIAYQKYRLDAEQFEPVYHLAHSLDIETDHLRHAVACYQEDRLMQWTAQEVMTCFAKQQTAYFHVDASLDFYEGNTGAALRRRGNLASASAKEIVSWLEQASANAYDATQIRSEQVLEAVSKGHLKRSARNLVYPDPINGLMAMIYHAQNPVEVL